MIDKNSKLYQIFKIEVGHIANKNAKEITAHLEAVDDETRFEMLKIEPRLLRYMNKKHFTADVLKYVSENFDWGLEYILSVIDESNLPVDIIKGCLKNNPMQIGDLKNPSDDLVKFAVLRHKKILKSKNAAQNDLDYGLSRILFRLYHNKTEYILSDGLVEFLISEYKNSANAIAHILEHVNLSQLEKLPDEVKLYIELETDMSDPK